MQDTVRVPISHLQIIALTAKKNSELAEIVEAHQHERDWLEAIADILEKRKRANARELRTRIDDLLLKLPPAPKLKHRARWIVLAVGALAAITVGIGHGVGAEIWRIAWPWLQTTVLK